ncbi:hypothetical protein VTN00DRAFT_1370 [Thermoascus crustaceus]|uniref:uncharacterized protein n=1 Tax=Thermoascus crustaceus TaxID=5088 RepID=UPI0037427933
MTLLELGQTEISHAESIVTTSQLFPSKYQGAVGDQGCPRKVSAPPEACTATLMVLPASLASTLKVSTPALRTPRTEPRKESTGDYDGPMQRTPCSDSATTSVRHSNQPSSPYRRLYTWIDELMGEPVCALLNTVPQPCRDLNGCNNDWIQPDTQLRFS